MRVRFAERAISDLRHIANYIGRYDPAAALRVRSAILDSIAALSHFPEIGRTQDLTDVRKLVTRRYPYLIYYRVDVTTDTVVILTIQHPARDREGADI